MKQNYTAVEGGCWSCPDSQYCLQTCCHILYVGILYSPCCHFHAFLYYGGKVCEQLWISNVRNMQGMLVMGQQLNICDQQNNILMFGDILLSICVKSKKIKKMNKTSVGPRVPRNRIINVWWLFLVPKHTLSISILFLKLLSY